jgi:predicted GTPase
MNRPDDIVIPVMGITGVGKSSFINLLTDDDVIIGRELASCKCRFDRRMTSTSFHLLRNRYRFRGHIQV